VRGEYSPPKITVNRGSWARGLRPRAQFAAIQGRKGFREGRKEFGKKKCQVFSLFLSLFVFPSFDSDPGPLARPVPPAGQEFLAGGNIPGGGKRDR
jgi:hypothetical protein